MSVKHFFRKKLRTFMSLIMAVMMLTMGTIGVYADTANNVNESGSKKNSSGEAWRSKEGVGFSLDLADTALAPQYYNPYSTYSYNSYSFLALQGLTSEEISTLTKVFESLIDYGFTEEMAAGACGNLWQECTFEYTDATGGAHGLLQWADTRLTALERFASDKGTSWTDLNTQLEYMYKELDNDGYLNSVNNYLSRYGNNTSASSVKDVQTACDAWCVAVEGCVCVYEGKTHSTHSSACAYASNGTSYQELKQRRDYAERIYDAMVRVSTGEIGGTYAGMSQSEIFQALYGASKATVQSWSYDKRSSYVGPFKLSNGTVLYVHKKAGDELKAACDELIAMGYPFSGYCADSRGTASGGFSFHSCGLAIDINADLNPCKSWSGYGRHDANQAQVEKIVYEAFDTGKTSYSKTGDYIKSNYDVRRPETATQKVANVFRAHGWLWGRDFSTKADMMHFSLGEVTYDLCNEWITNHYEGTTTGSKTSSGSSDDD